MGSFSAARKLLFDPPSHRKSQICGVLLRLGKNELPGIIVTERKDQPKTIEVPASTSNVILRPILLRRTSLIWTPVELVKRWKTAYEPQIPQHLSDPR